MKKAHEILKVFLENSPISAGETYHSFFRSWTRIAGLDAAAHSKVKDIQGEIVIISVDHPGWMQIIQMKKRLILRKIQQSYPELGIKDLRLHLYQNRDFKEKDKSVDIISNKNYIGENSNSGL